MQPIIYYLYHRNVWDNFCNASCYREDREKIQKWLHKALIFNVFGKSSDGVLAKVRKVFTTSFAENKIRSEITEFPVTAISQAIGNDLIVSDERLKEFVHYGKDNKYSFPVLALLFPGLDYRTTFGYHKDHMFPADFFRSMKNEDIDAIPEERRGYYSDPLWWNGVVNLQLLNANENESKQDKSLNEWLQLEVKEHHKDIAELKSRCYIPDVKLDTEHFVEFVLAREKLLISKLKQILS